MHLSPKEIDKLILNQAGVVAQKRLWRGLKLYYPEAVALISTQILEFIRSGDTVANLMNKGKQLLGDEDVLPEVSKLIHEVQVEGTFRDGTKLVTVHDPICSQRGNRELALFGSGLPTGAPAAAAEVSQFAGETGPPIVPGELIVQEGSLILNEGKEVRKVPVTNMGDRPIQVGSHYPFFEVNPSLKFDRKPAYGFRLNIPSGTAVRFEPGAQRTVELVPISGERVIYGGNAFISGKLSSKNEKQALEKLCWK